MGQRPEPWRVKRAKAGAAERWRRDRLRRDRLAALSPLQHPGRIVLRVIAIRREIEVREAIVFDLDSAQEARRKIRALGLA